MRLHLLYLNNFQGIKDFTLNTNGNDVSIFGRNATGKTTLANSFTWLFFGKDSHDKKDFAVKTLDSNNNASSGLDHSVEGIFELNGRQFTLKRVYHELWTKKRGSAQAVFSGHSTDYYIDGVPAKEKEYTAYVAGIANEEVFKMLTSPAYFSETLDWKKRREILLQVCGDINDADVIASDNSLSELAGILKNRKLDDHKKVITAKKTEINKQLQSLPVRIDEVQRGLPDIAGINHDEIPGKIKVLKDRLQQKNAEITRIQGGGEIAEREKQLRVIEARILQLKNEVTGKNMQLINKKQKELNTLKSKENDLLFSINSSKRTIETITGDNDTLTAKMENLRNQWHAINKIEFIHEESDTCPTCGQSLPEEEVTQAREKAFASFNLEKAQKFEKINRDGIEAKEKYETNVSASKNITKTIETAEATFAQLNIDIEAKQQEIAILQEQIESVENNPAYIEAIQEKENTENVIKYLKTNIDGQITPVRAEITVLENEIDGQEKLIAQVDQFKRSQERITELKTEEKKLAAEYEQLERDLYLCEQFIRTKVNMLEEKINSKFEYARFKLFDQLINGGISEVCEVLYNGVPYSSGLNNGARVVVGMDIINTLSEHYGFNAPIWIDNAEAINVLPKMQSQMITLHVSDDLSLMVKTEENKIREEV
jgi:DNA repair exonuclease SbcCD ATPase subunit